MMLRGTVLVLMIATLAACGGRNSVQRADAPVELPFKAKLSKSEERAFSVSVEHEGKGLDELRESVRFEATKYCLGTFGGSDADWLIDPATNDWAFKQDGSRLIFNGECTAL
ncbi:MAG: hypothetical protein OXC60_20485 [Litoreibacter sp.]|nr:hypothetical protein [Litoreibacter sp.]MCY4337035.1 hypothetical protein [Litoreibacter sp.]